MNHTVAIIFGQFTGSPDTDPSYKDVLMDHFSDSIPCFFDQLIGHNLSEQLILPIGSNVCIEETPITLICEEGYLE